MDLYFNMSHMLGVILLHIMDMVFVRKHVWETNSVTKG